MEKREITKPYCFAWIWMLLNAVGGLFFLAGIAWGRWVWADNLPHSGDNKSKVVYPKVTKLDFDGDQIEGELRNPGEFYFQHKPEEKFNSLVKRRKDFHREMLRDVVLSK